MRQVPRSPTKHTHPAPQPESDAEEEEVGESSESEPENPVPVVQKKTAAAAAGMSKTEQERKRPASDPAPTGKAKKAKAGEEKAVAATPPAKAKKGNAELEKPVPEATPAGKAKKGKAELEKPAPDATPAGKAKKGKAEKAAPEAAPPGKGKKGGDKLEKPAALDPSPSVSKSEKPVRWGKDDEMKILEALAAHVKSEGELPKTDLLLASVRDRLVRKNCTYTDIYEKVRRLKERYEKAVSMGIVPSKEDELQMYNLSEAIWGEKAREAAAAVTSQKGGSVTKGKKGQANKEKMDGNAKGGAAKETAPSTANQSGDSHQKGSKKGQARLLEEATTTASPSKSKKQESHNEELNKVGGNLAKGNKGKTDKGNMDRDTDSLTPKETINANQNGGILIRSKEGEIHDDETEGDANVLGVRRGFDELQKLYSNLAVYVEEIESHHPCGETLKRAFGSIADEKAEGLESKIKKLRVAETKAEVRQGDIKKEVLNLLLSLVD
jgi:hypothetical protein